MYAKLCTIALSLAFALPLMELRSAPATGKEVDPLATGWRTDQDPCRPGQVDSREHAQQANRPARPPAHENRGDHHGRRVSERQQKRRCPEPAARHAYDCPSATSVRTSCR